MRKYTISTWRRGKLVISGTCKKGLTLHFKLAYNVRGKRVVMSYLEEQIKVQKSNCTHVRIEEENNTDNGEHLGEGLP